MNSPEQLFGSQPISEPRWLIVIKRLLLAIIALHLLIGLISSYRAYFQIHSLEITSAETIQPGSSIQTNVVTYGRAPADVRLELVQQGRTLLLGEQRVPANELGFYDPRTQKASFPVTIAALMLERLADGPAILRATAVGRPQWTRLPPPEIREVKVQIRKTLHSSSASSNINLWFVND